MQAICSTFPVFFIWLVPRRRQVEKIQRCFEYIALYGEKDADTEFIEQDYAKLSPKTAKRMGIKPPAENKDAGDHPAMVQPLGYTAEEPIGHSTDAGSEKRMEEE